MKIVKSWTQGLDLSMLEIRPENRLQILCHFSQQMV